MLARRGPIGPAWLGIGHALAMKGSTLGAQRERLAASRAALADLIIQPQLIQAELAFAYAWTSEWAFTVLLAECGQRPERGGH